MQFVADTLKRIDRTQQIIGLAIIVFIGMSIGGYFVYHQYVANRERQAHVRFSDSLEILLQSEAAGKNPERKKYQQGLQEEAELAFQAGYDQHSSSYLAPYFIAMQASALIKQGKQDEARELYQKALASMPSRSPLRNLFATEIALLQIDNEASHETGLKALQSLAADSANKYQDFAQYYLGQFYWSQGKMQEAKTIWLKLIEEQKQYGEAASPWAQLATTQVSQIS